MTSTDTPAGDPADAPTDAEQPAYPLLATPAEPLRPVVADERRLVEAARSLGAGHGPLAVDAERASGYRYGQHAYLVQLRRDGAGTWLVDPVACPDLTPIQDATADVEWVLHAATQDLPCLAEVGLRPGATLFDTELGCRLAGRPRVGLAAAVEHYLGITLAKEHSAVDWSTRPLPEPWLVYAALDVEVLVALRDAVEADLAAQGKLEWAHEEFAHAATFTGPPPRQDPWRRLSGVHKLRSRRATAVARELWTEREDIARARDVSPGRVIPDGVLVAIAADPSSIDQRLTRNLRRYKAPLDAAVQRAMLLPEADLPRQAPPVPGPPPPRAWADRDPVAAARLADVREGVDALSAEHDVPVENLLQPDALRRTLWDPPADRSLAGFTDALRERGARPWQAALVAPLMAAACVAHPDDPSRPRVEPPTRRRPATAKTAGVTQAPAAAAAASTASATAAASPAVEVKPGARTTADAVTTAGAAVTSATGTAGAPARGRRGPRRAQSPVTSTAAPADDTTTGFASAPGTTAEAGPDAAPRRRGPRRAQSPVTDPGAARPAAAGGAHDDAQPADARTPRRRTRRRGH